MTVVLHQEGLRHLLRDPLGPLGQYIDVKARAVDVQAHQNATGRPGPYVRDTPLFASLRYGGLEFDSDGLVAYIVTTARATGAKRQDFPYPLAQELGVGPGGAFPAPRRQPQQYRYPFLRPALESVFPGATVGG